MLWAGDMTVLGPLSWHMLSLRVKLLPIWIRGVVPSVACDRKLVLEAEV